MATVLSSTSAVTSTLIEDAMFQAQILGQDQTPNSGDVDLVLRRLNRMLESWSNEKQMIFTNDSETFTTVASQQAYSTTLLAGGRPIAINSMRVTYGSVDFPMDQIDQLTWNAIPVKTVYSIPNVFYYDAAMPDATFFFFPIPVSAMTVTLYCQRVLSAPLTLTTMITMPPGYEAAIVAGLAVDIMPSFGKQASKQQMDDMRQTRSVLKRTNYTPMEMALPSDYGAQDVSNAFLYRTF